MLLNDTIKEIYLFDTMFQLVRSEPQPTTVDSGFSGQLLRGSS